MSFDQALTARLLRVANSATSGTRVPINTVKDAIVRLGSATVLALAVAGAVRGRMKAAVPAYGLQEDQLWPHSVASALAVDRLTPLCKKPIPAEAFTAALLHDLGKLVLARFLATETVELLSRAESEGRQSRERAETELLEVHHAELGFLIAQRWGLPERIGRGIQYHHTPDAGGDVICDIVAVANLAAKTIKEAPMPPEPMPEVHRAARERLGLDENAWAQACERLAFRFSEVLIQFG